MDKLRNYQKELDEILSRKETLGKRLLLHSCCAPCSSYVLSYLRESFRITVLYFNPNITDREEYEKRLNEQSRLIDELNSQNKGFEISLIGGEYDPDLFFTSVKGLEACREGGERCKACFALRLGKAAQAAKEGGYDYFTTTLSISPLKDAKALNDIGQAMGEKHGAEFLPSDFKKKDGFKKSIELSKEHNLYRQDYCGCVFSRRDKEDREKREE